MISFKEFLKESNGGGFEEAPNGNFYGYKVMKVERGRLISGANGRLSFPMKIGSIIKMPGNGIFLSNTTQHVLNYYSGLADEEVLLKLKFSKDDIVFGKFQFFDNEPEIGISKVKIISITKL
jgi:hypothetical protein